MADENIEQRVTAIIVEKLGVDEADVNTDASFTNDLGADSLDTVELIMEFEKEFDMTIPDEPGDYVYVCTYPGHGQLMHGVLKVTK